MVTILLLLDVTIIAALLLLAWQALFRQDLFSAVVFFISFSLLLALAWVRLQAPDVALAEAAIGGGFTGALLLAAVRRMQSQDARSACEEDGHATD